MLEDYQKLLYWTLSLGDADFVHQHVVDAHAVQNAKKDDKPIKIFFALLGLYLYIEKKYTGKEIQNIHKKIADTYVNENWPIFKIPITKSAITETNVVNEVDEKRSDAIYVWCKHVWNMWSDQHGEIIFKTEEYMSGTINRYD